MKKNLFFSGAIFVVLISLIFSWYKISPGIVPSDVLLSGELKKEELSPEPKLPTKGGYVVEITLDKRTNKPLYISDHHYFSMVYVFVDGFTPFVWDFFKGPNVEEEGYSFGSDSRMIRIVADKLEEIGYTVDDSMMDINKLNQSTIGFAYSGNKFPTRTRIYLTPLDKELNPDTKAYLVYVHYEKRWGKDLSWAKVEPIKIIE